MEIEYRIFPDRKAQKWVIENAEFVHDDHIGKKFAIGTVRDITGLKKAELEREEVERKARRSESLVRMAAEKARFGGWRYDVVTGEETWSEGTAAIRGLSGDAGFSFDDAMNSYRPEDRDRLERMFRDCVAFGTPFDGVFKLVKADGHEGVVRTIGEPEYDGAGNVVAVQGAVQDVTDLARAREEAERRSEELKKSKERLELISKVTSDFIWEWDIENDEWRRSDEHEHRLGISKDRPGSNFEETMSLIHHEDRDRVRKEILDAIRDGRASVRSEYRVLDRNGETRQLESRAAIVRDEEGKALRLVGGQSDVTEYRELDQRLYEAEKLDSIGQLTGGIAHDFNNLLTIIIGNADTLLDKSPDEEIQKIARTTLDAAQRGASLIDSLLAFARRQPLREVPTDVNELILKSRTLFEKSVKSGVSITFDLCAEEPVARLDANRLQSSILNLVINSGHAVGESGEIEVSTRNVFPELGLGTAKPSRSAVRHLCISVSDNGVGMPAEVMEQAFEPFFTTRPAGVGSGLGLSSVYGFAKQSGGFAKITSNEGEGTVVSLFLPTVDSASKTSIGNGDKAFPEGGGERILVVEDNDLLRKNVKRQLEALGYTVVTAQTVAQAMDVLRSTEGIDLVFSDVVLPGEENGRDLVLKVRHLHPNLPVVLTSGYSDPLLFQSGELAEDIPLLRKPYRFPDLAKCIKTALSDDPVSKQGRGPSSSRS